MLRYCVLGREETDLHRNFHQDFRIYLDQSMNWRTKAGMARRIERQALRLQGSQLAKIGTNTKNKSYVPRSHRACSDPASILWLAAFGTNPICAGAARVGQELLLSANPFTYPDLFPPFAPILRSVQASPRPNKYCSRVLWINHYRVRRRRNARSKVDNAPILAAIRRFDYAFFR